jgi:hypothetical protein
MLTESQSNLHHPLGFLFLLHPVLVSGFWTGVVIELWILRFGCRKGIMRGWIAVVVVFVVETEVNMHHL